MLAEEYWKPSWKVHTKFNLMLPNGKIFTDFDIVGCLTFTTYLTLIMMIICIQMFMYKIIVLTLLHLIQAAAWFNFNSVHRFLSHVLTEQNIIKFGIWEF
jgi:hypothetical protein